MACDAVQTGQRFVAQTVAHIDCQAQAIGAYGYGALADPNSAVSIALMGLMTIFVAIFGFRLLLGEHMGPRDLIGDALKVGIVLTLATSWPAWRTLGYDLVMKGPEELAAVVGGASDLPGSKADLVARLQSADDGIVMLTVFGTGRNTGGTNRSDTIGDSFRGIALADQEGLADGRIAYLSGILAPLAILRLGAGLMLALAPLMAGLLLFAGTRDLFFGWLRGLGALALGGLTLTVMLSVELAILEPWIRDALALREARVLTPSAPTELAVITWAFMLAIFAMLFLVAKIFFFGGLRMPQFLQRLAPAGREGARGADAPLVEQRREAPSRAFVVAEAVAQNLRREERTADYSRTIERLGAARGSAQASATTGGQTHEPLGSSYRTSESRSFRRTSAANANRDKKA